MGHNTVYVVITDMNRDDESLFSISTHEPAAHARAGQALARSWCYSVTMLAWDTDTQESVEMYVWYRTEVERDRFPCPVCGHSMHPQYPCSYCRVREPEYRWGVESNRNNPALQEWHYYPTKGEVNKGLCAGCIMETVDGTWNVHMGGGVLPFTNLVDAKAYVENKVLVLGPGSG